MNMLGASIIIVFGFVGFCIECTNLIEDQDDVKMGKYDKWQFNSRILAAVFYMLVLLAYISTILV